MQEQRVFVHESSLKKSFVFCFVFTRNTEGAEGSSVVVGVQHRVAERGPILAPSLFQ